ncbi:hypothetical protein NITGR_730048 [Nitrospina gracilis 3/211]|uniref:Uncharacterized protein n=1 Tax=Nitrospina gracilis (strain 3/211) TaxID=1266370 RepID=M1ZDM9_NITG3|nr:hypothetical protein NITGR_730048 [Nitrospina gracilis 3/211]
MEPKSLNQIITEEEFLPLVQDASASFFRNFNAYRVLVNETGTHAQMLFQPHPAVRFSRKLSG